MRGNEQALALLIVEADAIGFLPEFLLTDVPAEMNLAAAHLLAIICRDDTAKVQAVRICVYSCRDDTAKVQAVRICVYSTVL
jgi:hypothetical protein